MIYPCHLISSSDVIWRHTVYPKKYAHGFCFAVLCCGYTLTDFPISIRLTSLVLWQSNDCPSASKATLMNMDKYFMWIHYERLHNHNKAKHNKTVCIFLGIYCRSGSMLVQVVASCLTSPTYYLNQCWLWLGSQASTREQFYSECPSYYRKTSGISRAKSPSLNVSCILLQLSSLNPLKPCVKLRMKM